MPLFDIVSDLPPRQLSGPSRSPDEKIRGVYLDISGDVLSGIRCGVRWTSRAALHGRVEEAKAASTLTMTTRTPGPCEPSGPNSKDNGQTTTTSTRQLEQIVTGN